MVTRTLLSVNRKTVILHFPAAQRPPGSGTTCCARAKAASACPIAANLSRHLPIMLANQHELIHINIFAHAKCTYTKPMEIEGAKSTDEVSTATDDINGNSARSRGFHVATMDSGDKFFVWYQGAGEVKDGGLQSQKGTWGFTGGSGKLKGIKGKGTYTCTPSDQGFSCEVEGQYQLAK